MPASPRTSLWHSPGKAAGFSLVEIAVALGILAFSISALLGVFVLGINTDRESIEELQGTHILKTILAERRASPTLVSTNLVLPPMNSNSVCNSANAISLDEIGRPVSGSRTGKFGLVYSVTPNATTNSAAVYCAIYWPGQAAPANALGKVEMATKISLP